MSLPTWITFVHCLLFSITSIAGQTLLPITTTAMTTDEQPLTCGRRIIQKYARRNGRVVGGQNSYLGEFPWTASIRLPRGHHCGGTIIDEEWILTAAHCVVNYGPEEYRVRLGSVLKTDEFMEDESLELKVIDVVIHEQYAAPRRYSHDIALLRLEKPINFTEYILPICLPPEESADRDNIYQGVKATVVGWGWTSIKKLPVLIGIYPEVLQKVDLRVIPNLECMAWFRSRGINLILDMKQFCAGYKDGGKDSCSGDSGGPLVIKDDVTGKHFIIGIVSAGVGCAEPRLPGVYTRVSAYIPWITKITQREH